MVGKGECFVVEISLLAWDQARDRSSKILPQAELLPTTL